MIGNPKDPISTKQTKEVYDAYHQFYERFYDKEDVALTAELFVSIQYPDFVRKFPKGPKDQKDVLLANIDYDMYQKHHLDDNSRRGLRMAALFNVILSKGKKKA